MNGSGTKPHRQHKSPKGSRLYQYDTTNLILLGLALLAVNALFVVNRIDAKKTVVSQILTSQQAASTPVLSAKISNVAEINKPDPAFTLSDGETLLTFDLSITNNTNEQQNLVPVNHFYVRTREGDYRTLHPSIYVHNGLPSGELKPHQTVKGPVSFGVPKQATDLYFYIDTGWNNQVPVVFNVLK
jgi:hypothetical protein